MEPIQAEEDKQKKMSLFVVCFFTPVIYFSQDFFRMAKEIKNDLSYSPKN